MKFAITGKGGVGKSTFTALLGQYLARHGQQVLLVDADPTRNLGGILGVPDADQLIPIAEMKSLIQERMGADPDAPGTYFRMNPRVADLPASHWVEHEGIKLIVMGSVAKGGAGCACAINAFLKTLVSHLILQADEWIVLDMEAGVEHLGRGTATGVDRFFIVVEPSLASLETGRKIAHLAKDLGIDRISVVGNKVQDTAQSRLLEQLIDFGQFVGHLPYQPEIAEAALRHGRRVVLDDGATRHLEAILTNALGAGVIGTTPSNA